MKRIVIKNTSGMVIAGAQMEDPTSWVAVGTAANWWGLPQREKRESECTPQEIASALSSRDVQEGNDLDGNVILVKYYLLPVQYTITITDIQAEIDAENTRITQIQTFKQAVKTILQKADVDVTTAEVKAALLKFLRASLLKGDLD